MQQPPPRNEFLRGPRWRTRARPGMLITAVGVTFTVIVGVGWAVLAGILWVLDRGDVPTPWRHAVWIVPTIIVLAWVLWRPDPASASEEDQQGWSDYAVRSVMVGVERRRAAPVRAVAGLVFGAPLALYLVTTVVLSLAGIM